MQSSQQLQLVRDLCPELRDNRQEVLEGVHPDVLVLILQQRQRASCPSDFARDFMDAQTCARGDGWDWHGDDNGFEAK